MYSIKRPSRSEFVSVRHLQYHVRLWGEPAPHKTPLVLLHGWMDVAASYQFVVDALTQDHFIIAPDWRGFGLTAIGQNVDNFWFPDYMADLDWLLNHYAPDQAVNLVGHSMGGNIAMPYAGVRPQRVRRLINLEGFGMPATQPNQAAERYARWMDELQGLHNGDMELAAYESVDGVTRRLMKNNPRLSLDKASWLAAHWSQADAQGQWRILGHAGHKVVSATLFHLDEILSIYQRITAPTLSVQASDDSLQQWYQGQYTLAEFHDRLKSVPNLQIRQLPDCGHMLHHDQPQALAQLIEQFIV